MDCRPIKAGVHSSEAVCCKKSHKKEDRVAILQAYDESKGAVKLLLEKQRLGKPSNTNSESDDTAEPVTAYEFFERFISSGDQLTRKELDEGGSRFWEQIVASFISVCDTYDSLVSDLPLLHGICPDQITVHSATKLQAMWKDVHRAFYKAEARNKVPVIIRNSGTIVWINRSCIYISGVNFVGQGVNSVPGAYMTKMKTIRPKRVTRARALRRIRKVKSVRTR
ncbi:hypothetical protein GQ600_14981 [Phytophthora cactorum]|nr:hypothetical protein GQ600_14981 [Phytophthora cactorum]